MCSCNSVQTLHQRTEKVSTTAEVHATENLQWKHASLQTTSKNRTERGTRLELVTISSSQDVPPALCILARARGDRDCSRLRLVLGDRPLRECKNNHASDASDSAEASLTCARIEPTHGKMGRRMVMWFPEFRSFCEPFWVTKATRSTDDSLTRPVDLGSCGRSDQCFIFNV